MAENTKFAEAALLVTRQWATEELEAARNRATNLRVGGQAYNDAIESVDNLVRMIDGISYLLGEKKLPECTTLEEVPVIEHPAETEAAAVFEDQPARVVDIAEVRSKAKAARDAGVKLADVWAKFDATKLSEVPQTKYALVLAMLDEKMQELDS